MAFLFGYPDLGLAMDRKGIWTWIPWPSGTLRHAVVRGIMASCEPRWRLHVSPVSFPTFVTFIVSLFGNKTGYISSEIFSICCTNPLLYNKKQVLSAKQFLDFIKSWQKIPQIFSSSAQTIMEITPISVMFPVPQLNSFFPFLTHSSGMNKYISVV